MLDGLQSQRPVSVQGLFQLTSFLARLHQASDGQLLLMSIKMISSQVTDEVLFPFSCLHLSSLSFSIYVVSHISRDK